MCSKAGLGVHDKPFLLEDAELVLVQLLPLCELTDSFCGGAEAGVFMGEEVCPQSPALLGLCPFPPHSGGRLPSRMMMILGFSCPLQPCGVGSDFCPLVLSPSGLPLPN